MSRGFALAIVLFLTVVLMMLSGTMITRVRAGSNFQLTGRDQTAAFWAAQSGVAYSLARWSEDKSWVPGAAEANYELPGGARFTVNSTRTVNNLLQDSPTSCELGAGTVPAHRAYVVVHGWSNGRTQSLRALIGPSGLGVTNREAMLATGNVTMLGTVKVVGSRSTDDTSAVPADLISLNGDNDTGIIKSTGNVDVQGAVRCNSGLTGSIAQANINASEGFETGATVVRPGDPDIAGRVAAHAGDATPTLTPGTTTIGAGDWHVSGDLNYTGDLDLAGCNLYVDGTINVTGSVSGRGSLFATGDAKLMGTANIKAADEEGLALFVKGDVDLAGLNGTKYLKDVCQTAGSDPNGVAYSTHLTHVSDFLGLMRNELQGPGNMADGSGDYATYTPLNHRDFSNAPGVSTSDFDGLVDAFAFDTHPFNAGQIVLSDGPMDITTEVNPFSKVQNLVATDTSAVNASVRDFVQKRLTALHDPVAENGLFSHHNYGFPEMIGNLVNVVTTGGVDGLADGLNDVCEQTQFTSHPLLQNKKTQLLQRLVHTVNTLNFDQLGAARFQGQVYCEGNLVCRDEIHVIGSIVANGTKSNITLNNCHLTYVPELANQAGSTLGTVSVRLWLRD